MSKIIEKYIEIKDNRIEKENFNITNLLNEDKEYIFDLMISLGYDYTDSYRLLKVETKMKRIDAMKKQKNGYHLNNIRKADIIEFYNKLGVPTVISKIEGDALTASLKLYNLVDYVEADDYDYVFISNLDNVIRTEKKDRTSKKILFNIKNFWNKLGLNNIKFVKKLPPIFAAAMKCDFFDSIQNFGPAKTRIICESDNKIDAYDNYVKKLCPDFEKNKNRYHLAVKMFSKVPKKEFDMIDNTIIENIKNFAIKNIKCKNNIFDYLPSNTFNNEMVEYLTAHSMTIKEYLM